MTQIQLNDVWRRNKHELGIVVRSARRANKINKYLDNYYSAQICEGEEPLFFFPEVRAEMVLKMAGFKAPKIVLKSLEETC